MRLTTCESIGYSPAAGLDNDIPWLRSILFVPLTLDCTLARRSSTSQDLELHTRPLWIMIDLSVGGYRVDPVGSLSIGPSVLVPPAWSFYS